jgi:hypothetical protein
MLNVRLTIRASSCNKCRVALGDESDDVRGQAAGKPTRCGLARIRFPRTAPRLLGAHG